jgi:hypothetical protein
VRHLAALEAERSFHLVAVLQEADGLVAASDKVVIVNGDGEFDFLDDDDFLPLAGSAVALFLLVEELAVVLNAANGGNGGGRDFHQVEATFAGDLQRFEGWEDAELLAFFVDDPNLASANTLVDSDKLLRGTLIDGFFSWSAGLNRAAIQYINGWGS